MTDLTTHANASIAILTTSEVKTLPTQSVYRCVEALDWVTNTELLVNYNEFGLLSESKTLELRSAGVIIIYI
jgi:hypothetical protein